MKHEYTVTFNCGPSDLVIGKIIANDAEGAIAKARAKVVELGHPRMFGNRVLEVVCTAQNVQISNEK